MDSHAGAVQGATTFPPGSTATSNSDPTSLQEKEKDIATNNDHNDPVASNTMDDEEKVVPSPNTDLGTTPEQPQGEETTYTGWRKAAVCATILSIAFLYGLDNTIAADIQGAVVEDFGEVDKLGWIGIGYSMGSVATIFSLGKAYGLFSVKWMYIGSIITFVAGSALCGAAPTSKQSPTSVQKTD